MSNQLTTGKHSSGVATALRLLFNWKVLAVLALFVILALAFQSQSDGVFLTSRNMSLMLRQAAVLSIVAGGVAILIIMSEIDLSIGSAVYLVGVIAATAQTAWGTNVFVTVAIAIGAGLLLGAWQGFWVAKVGVPSFIVTLAGLLMFRGIGLSWTEAKTISPLNPDFVGLSGNFIAPNATVIGGIVIAGLIVFAYFRRASTEAKRGRHGTYSRAAVQGIAAVAMIAVFVWVVSGYRGTPTALIWAALIAVVLWFVMSKTVFGRNVYMIGSNRAASTLAGIPVRKNIFMAFVLMGALYGIAAVLFTARLNASTANDGQNLELDAIAAAVIGGVALTGGKGRLPAVLGGVLLLTMIDNGMSVMGVSSFAQMVIKGGILLIAVAVDAYRRNNVRIGGIQLKSKPPKQHSAEKTKDAKNDAETSDSPNANERNIRKLTKQNS